MAENNDAKAFDGIAEGRTPSEHYTEPEEDRKLVGHLLDKFRATYENRLPQAADWSFFRDYMRGDQFIVRHKDTGEIIQLAPDEGRKLRAVNNYLRPVARSLVGKLTRVIPTVEVTPATTDVDEFHAARAANNYVQFFRNKEELDDVYLDLCEYLPWAGNAFVELDWDVNAGDDVVACPVCDYFHEDMETLGTECPKCMLQREHEIQAHQMAVMEYQAQGFNEIIPQLPEGVIPDESMLDPNEAPQPQQMGPLPLDQEVPSLIEAKEGDIKINVIDVHDFFPEPGIDCLKNATYYFIRSVVPTVLARQLFPEGAAWITDDQDLYTDTDSDSLRQNSYNGDFDLFSKYTTDSEMCRILKYVERPTSEYPDGRVIYIINDKIVRVVNSTPFRLFNRFPIFHFGFDRNPGNFWFDPPLANAWHRQKEMNDNETYLREHLTLLYKPKIFIPIGSKISTDEMTAESAQMIPFNRAAGTPEPLKVASIPGEIFMRNETFKDDIRTQFGVTLHEIGQAPQDPNGRAMAILEAEADQMLGPVIKRNNKEWKELYRCALIMAQKYLPEEKLFSLVGPDGHQTFAFRDVKMLKKGWDLYLEEDDGLAKNQAVRITQAMDLANLGFFMDPATGMFDKKAFAAHAKIKISSAGFDHEASERSRASELPYMFEQGEPWTPQPFDVPIIWKEELESWLRGPGRRADPYILQEVLAAWEFYSMWAIAGQIPPGLGQPQAGRAPPIKNDTSAPGGTSNNPGHLGTETSANMQQAQTNIQGADAAGEYLSRITAKHEG